MPPSTRFWSRVFFQEGVVGGDIFMAKLIEGHSLVVGPDCLWTHSVTGGVVLKRQQRRPVQDMPLLDLCWQWEFLLAHRFA